MDRNSFLSRASQTAIPRWAILPCFLAVALTWCNAALADNAVKDLHKAVVKGDAPKAAALAPKVARYDAAENLNLAAKLGQLNVVQAMVGAGVDINGRIRLAEQSGGRSAWLDLDTMWRFSNEWLSQTALITAARAGKLEVVKWLAEHGAKLDLQDTVVAFKDMQSKDGMTVFRAVLAPNGNDALSAAILANQTAVAQFLVEHGADISQHIVYRSAAIPSMRGWSFQGILVETNDGSVIPVQGNHLRQDDQGFIHTDLKITVQAESTPLHLAAATGQKDVAELLVAKGANVNDNSIEGATPLLSAALNGQMEVAEFLIAKGANLEAKTNDGVTPLHMAAQEGKTKMVELLLAKGADIRAKTNDGMTPLHLAAAAGHRDTAELLIAEGADVNAKANGGVTPLRSAISYKHDDVALLLRLHQAEEGPIAKRAASAPPAKDTKSSPSTVACEICAAAKDGNLARVQMLLKGDPELVTSKDANGLMPLHIAAFNGHKDVAELLLANKADVNAKSAAGKTPLDAAAFMGHLDVAQSLIAKGADVNAKDSNGRTPLQEAAGMDKRDMAALLLKSGADVHAKSNNGWTALHDAAFAGHQEVAELLLANGADINARNNDSLTALDLAISGYRTVSGLTIEQWDTMHDGVITQLRRRGSQDTPDASKLSGTIHYAAANGDLALAQKLLNDNPALVSSRTRDYGETPLFFAAKNGHADVAELLIAKGADVKAVSYLDWTPLLDAVEGGSKEVVELLISKGADITAPNGSASALFVAVTAHHENVAELLVAHGADVNARDYNGDTPLHEAATRGGADIARFLLANKAAVDAKDRFGTTPLINAVRSGKKDIAEMLLASGADPNAKNDEGWTPLYMAANFGYKDIVELLLAKGADANAKTRGWTPLHVAVKTHHADIAEVLRQHGGHE